MSGEWRRGRDSACPSARSRCVASAITAVILVAIFIAIFSSQVSADQYYWDANGSGSNAQNWRFIIVRERPTKERMLELWRRTWGFYLETLAVADARRDTVVERECLVHAPEPDELVGGQVRDGRSPDVR